MQYYALCNNDTQPRGFGNRTHMHVLMLVPAQHSVHAGVRTFMVAEIDALPRSVYYCVACFTICASAEQQRNAPWDYLHVCQLLRTSWESTGI